MKLPYERKGMRFYIVLLALLAGRSTNMSILFGAQMIVLGVVLHVWAKGCLRQKLEVTKTGPYRFVRHPFYLAYAFIDIGIAIMSGWLLLELLVPLWWLTVYIPTIKREEAYLSRRFPDAYEDYQRRVPALVPFRRPLPRIIDGFSWQNRNIMEGREIPRALRLLSYPLLFFVWHGLRAGGVAFMWNNQGLGFLAAVAFFVLHGAAWEMKRSLKDRRPVFSPIFHRLEFRLFAVVILLALAGTLTIFETEADWLVMPAGAIILFSAIAVRHLDPRASLMAEAMTVIAIMIFCEMIWLAGPLILLYMGLALDNRLADGDRPLDRRRETACPPMLVPHFYTVMFIGGVALALAKEFLID